MRSLRHAVFIAYLGAMLSLLLLPMPKAPSGLPGQFDKLVHFGLFVGFALLYTLDQGPSVLRVLVVSAGFAGAIELIQAFLPYRRADWGDALAGLGGAVVGVLVLSALRRRQT